MILGFILGILTGIIIGLLACLIYIVESVKRIEKDEAELVELSEVK